MSDRPNIVLLVGEDAGARLRCLGDRDAVTPHLDRLASQGTLYPHAYTVGPVCAPSRSCMVTGRYPWSLGTHHMRSTLLAPPRLFTHELIDAGYHVSWPDKTDFNFAPPADFASDRVEWWAKGLPTSGKPFFAYRNVFVTHESTMWDVDPWGGGPSYAARCAALADADRTDTGSVRVPAYLPDVPEVRREIARFYDSAKLLDREVGQTLALLDEAGVADDTAVIYLADHGRGLAREKRWCYDAGVHVSLIIRWPGSVAAGTIDRRVVSWADLAPTILSIAGVRVPEAYEGQPIFTSTRTHALSGRDRMDEQFDRVRSITDGRHRYVRNDFPQLRWGQRNHYQENSLTTRALRRLAAQRQLESPADVFMRERKPDEELYDVERDPDNVVNLASDPAHQDLKRSLRAALEAELRRTGDLGMTDESELVARGLLADRCESEYRPRIAPLPPEFASTGGPSALTMNEAAAIA
jgi:N-sulfoglucosamine sulfohydrolase